MMIIANVILLGIALLIGFPLIIYNVRVKSTKSSVANGAFWVLMSSAFITIRVLEGDWFFTVVWIIVLMLNGFSLTVNVKKLLDELKDNDDETIDG